MLRVPPNRRLVKKTFYFDEEGVTNTQTHANIVVYGEATR